jgi:hypothetical protein
VIVGEGRHLGEKSIVVVKNNHVLGYGYAEAGEDEIFSNPESFFKRRFFHHLGVDLATKRYIRILKNSRQKTESWRSMSAVESV